MATACYYEELPLSTVIKAQKLIESKIRKDELKLACECASQCTAFAELNGNNGVKLYVARAHKYNQETEDYDYHVQLLDEDLKVIESLKYRKPVEGDFGYGISEWVRCSDGYSVDPLFHIAATVLRKTRVK